MLFDSYHVGYIAISLIITIALIISFFFVKKQSHKEIILKTFALATFLLHISVMWVNYLKNGSASAPDSVLFPIYFCNLSMYMLIIVAFMRNKQGNAFKYLATFTAYAGFFGAMISLFYPDYYLTSNDMFAWGTFKSLLSHSTMLVGCIYLFTGGFIKVRVSNLIAFGAGLIASGFVGIFMNWLFVICGLHNPNSMYLVAPAIDGVPLFMGWLIAFMLLALTFAFTAIFEMFAVEKEKRWYNTLLEKFKEKRVKANAE